MSSRQIHFRCDPAVARELAMYFDTMERAECTCESQTIANVLVAPKVYRKPYRQRKQPLTDVPAGWSA